MRGELAGDDDSSKAASLAGALAEMGVRRLALSIEGADDTGGWRDLRALETDLPGELLGALERAGDSGAVELSALDRPLRVEIRGGSWRWEAGGEEVARELRALSADSHGPGA